MLPVGVVAHPEKLYPVFENPEPVGKVKPDPPVVYELEDGAEPVPPFVL